MKKFSAKSIFFKGNIDQQKLDFRMSEINNGNKNCFFFLILQINYKKQEIKRVVEENNIKLKFHMFKDQNSEEKFYFFKTCIREQE